MGLRRLVLSALVLALAGGTANAAQKLTMNYTTGESATAFIAKDEGFFAKHGLDVDLIAVAQNSNAPAALESGSVQIGMIQVANLLQLADGGLDFVALAGGAGNKKDVNKIRSGGAQRPRREGREGAYRQEGGRAWDRRQHRYLLPQLATQQRCRSCESLDRRDDVPRHGRQSQSRQSRCGDAARAVHHPHHVAKDRLRAVQSRQSVAPAKDQRVALRVDARSGRPRTHRRSRRFRAAIAEADDFIRANPDKTRAAINKYTQVPMPILSTCRSPRSMPRSAKTISISGRDDGAPAYAAEQARYGEAVGSRVCGAARSASLVISGNAPTGEFLGDVWIMGFCGSNAACCQRCRRSRL